MAISTLGVCIALAAATTAPAARGPVADLARGFLALRAGEYHESARALDGLAARLPRNRDYALYLLGESLFYDGSYAKARAAFNWCPVGNFTSKAYCIWSLYIRR